MEMEVSGYTYNRDATHLLNPDSAEYAKICGGDGIRVEKAVDVLPAIKAAIASPRPYITDAIVSPGEFVMPPHVTVEQACGFGMVKIKEGILGLKGDHAQ